MRLCQRHGDIRQSVEHVRACIAPKICPGNLYLSRRRFNGLFYEVDEIWRAQFAEGL